MTDFDRIEIVKNLSIHFHQNLLPQCKTVDDYIINYKIWLSEIKNKYQDSEIDVHARDICLTAISMFTSLEKSNPKTLLKALIMKGGGIKGLAYVGALEELNKHYQFNWYAGTSAGAIAAILLAAGYDTRELKEILSTKDFSDFKDANLVKKVWNLFSKKGLYEANTFTTWLDQLLSKKLDSPVDIKLGELPNRATVYASKRGQSALIFDSSEPSTSNTRAAFSARCSMSIPFFFTPQSTEGIVTFDGGVQNNYPVDVLLKNNPGTEFIGLYLGPKIYEGSPKNNSIIKELFSIWTESTDEEALRKYRDKTIIIDPRPISTLQFKLNNEEKEFLLESGRLAAKEFLIKNKIVNDGYYSKESIEKQQAFIEETKTILLIKKKKNKQIRFIIFLVSFLVLIIGIYFIPILIRWILNFFY